MNYILTGSATLTALVGVTSELLINCYAFVLQQEFIWSQIMFALCTLYTLRNACGEFWIQFILVCGFYKSPGIWDMITFSVSDLTSVQTQQVT